MEFVTVIKPGLFTTVQDLGRLPYQVYGVSPSGAMDPLALRLGNLLVGNDEGEAALEVTLIGPQVRFDADGVVALTGADLSPSLNGDEVPMWKAMRVSKGDKLSFGTCRYGCRSYICFAGGIQVPKVMGSRSTFVRGKYGGIEGRALKSGDQIPIGKSPFNYRDLSRRRLKFDMMPDYKATRPVRFIWGPHADSFIESSIKDFTSNVYTVTNDSDRMGYRLDGAALHHANGADIISDSLTVGTIQVPSNGQPIVCMTDHGSSGGFTKIGVMISVDIPYIAQKKPGDTINFEAVDLAEAQQLWKKQEQQISALKVFNRLIPRIN